MKSFCICIGMIFLSFLTSYPQNYNWIKQFGSTGDDVGYAILENNNSIYVAGWFQNTVTFDTFTLTSAGDDDIFLLRMTHDGVILWANRFGGYFEDNVVGMVVDPIGNIYLSGFCSENADFGEIYLPGFGMADAFICRVRDDGEVIWAISGGSYNNDRAYRLSISPSGDFLAFTGYYNGYAQFGPFILPPFEVKDAFIARVDTSGFFDWVFASGNWSDQSGYGIAIDTEGYIYSIGYFFSDTWSVGPFTLYNSNPWSSADCSLIKSKSNAIICYAKSFGGTADDLPRPLYVDKDYLYIGGYHYGCGDYLGVPITGDGYYRDSFLLKADTSGNGIWVLEGLSQLDDELIGLRVVDDHHISISGGYNGDLKIGEQIFPSHGLYDAFVVNIDASTGIPYSAITGGGPGNDGFYGIDKYSTTILATGSFENTAVFDSIPLLSEGMRDIIILKIEDLPVGFTDKHNPKMGVFPNPCIDKFTISFPFSNQSPRNLMIKNINGRILIQVDNIIDQQVKIDVSSLDPGIYFIQVSDKANNMSVSKLIIN